MSNTVWDTARVVCCTDCVIIMENGDNSGLTEDEFAVWERGVDREALCSNGWAWSGVQCDDWDSEDDTRHDDECSREGWFSWSWCEHCGSVLGGQRFNVAIMRRIV